MELKLCPTCKTFVFEDMDTCYGCMYRFGSDPAREEAVRREVEGSDFPEDVLNEERCGGVGCALDESPVWPPPAEGLCDEAPEPASPIAPAIAEATVPPVKVVVVGAWRVGLREKTVACEGAGLEITVEPTLAQAALRRTQAPGATRARASVPGA